MVNSEIDRTPRAHGQNLHRQIAALRSAKCSGIFREKASGESVLNRPRLEKALAASGRGDVRVVAEWDRATRSMMDGVHLIERINKRGALIKVLDKPHPDRTTPIARGFIAFLSALAEDERQRIVKHANDGRKAIRACGARFGRKPKPRFASAEGSSQAAARRRERTSPGQVLPLRH